MLRILGVSVLAVAVLFLGYELVERTWLLGVEPEVLHSLHLLRGLSAAAIAAALATVLLLRQMSDPSASLRAGVPAKDAQVRGQRPWKRRLQHATLRTKIVVPMVALAMVPTLVIGALTISRAQESLRDSAVERVEFDTASKARSIQEFLETVRQDLRFLSEIKAVRDLAAAEAQGVPEPLAALRADVEREFLIFSQGKRAYYQVRYLDHAGREVVRLNVENGLPWIVTQEKLQDKGDRYYVRAALALEPGAIYVSPIDLNVEYGKVEVPVRGVLRYATRVMESAGKPQGLLVINIYSDFISSLVGPLPKGTEAWLVAEDGKYLGYAGESEERRSLFGLETGRRLDQDYGAEEVSAILREGNGGRTIGTSGALLSFAPVAFEDGGSAGRWKLVIARPRGPFEVPIRYLTVFLSVVTALVAAVAGVIGVLVAHYLARPVADLRRATREVAAGNLGKHVEIATGDEIEALAMDFNAMTERLREAQGRLAAWNAELEREVARQTEHLRRLQTGLARVDKLASIGQMTAGVMHEIGNPLASIVANIQDAEEGNELCRGCREVLPLVESEVDRLATFLRSFSRLANLREPRLEDVALPEVVDNVVTLVAAELHRRGLSLRVESPGDGPKIRGDPDQLRQLLINLILNSAEASPGDGEILMRIRRGSERCSNGAPSAPASIDVVDHGEGIAPEDMEKIWDPFFTTKPEGTGLGLAICRRIVNDHGGTIEARSEPGKGTVVTVTFPGEVAREASVP